MHLTAEARASIIIERARQKRQERIGLVSEPLAVSSEARNGKYSPTKGRRTIHKPRRAENNLKPRKPQRSKNHAAPSERKGNTARVENDSPNRHITLRDHSAGNPTTSNEWLENPPPLSECELRLPRPIGRLLVSDARAINAGLKAHHRLGYPYDTCGKESRVDRSAHSTEAAALSSSDQEQLPGIVDALSSYQRDMFGSFPVALTDQDSRLLSYWMIRFPTMVSLDDHPTVLSRYNGLRNVFFPFALSNELAFETLIILFAAYHIHRTTGFDDMEYLESHRIKASLLVRQKIDDLSKHGSSDDGDMVGFLAFTYLEYHFGDKSMGMLHLGAFRKFCRLRRLNGIFPSSSHTDTIVQWSCSNNTACSYPNIATDPAIRAEFESDLAGLYAFLETSREVATRSRHNIFEAGAAATMPLRASAFAPGSLLHRILTRIPGWAEGEELRRHIYCKLEVLVHINRALIDRQSSPAEIEKFIKELSRVFLELKLDTDQNPLQSCLWSLIHDPALHDMRMSKSYRIYLPCKTLTTPDLALICDALLSYLALGAQGLNERIYDTQLPVIDFPRLQNVALNAAIVASKLILSTPPFESTGRPFWGAETRVRGW